VAPEKTNAVAGMINFMRNMGSSVGTSMVTTLIARRAQFHQTMLVEDVSAGRGTFQHTLAALAERLTASGVSRADARAHAYPLVYQAVQAQAATLAYIDVFWLLSIGAAIMCAASFLLAKNNPHAAGPALAE
jgi:MFS transporter, DHA2 family, multidrug resistance protein